MTIEFTQYIRPKGEKRLVGINRSQETEEKAKRLIGSGCHFDIEILTTGEVSMTCEKDSDLLSIRVCENGEAVVKCVDDLISESYDMIFSTKS